MRLLQTYATRARGLPSSTPKGTTVVPLLIRHYPFGAKRRLRKERSGYYIPFSLTEKIAIVLNSSSRIHHQHGRSYYPIPCTIHSTEDAKLVMNPDVPTHHEETLSNRDSFQGLTTKSSLNMGIDTLI
ncbi:hypothetical protein Tco_0885557 [Tanacetum coccineum]